MLEPQPWSSYGKRKNLTPQHARNFASISLRPDAFERCLIDEIGFRSCERLEVSYSDRTSAGFKRRPLLVLLK